MHILAYILGLIYYVIAPLSLFPSGVGRTITNTYIAYRHGYTNIKLNDQGQGSLLFLDWSCWIGAAIFMFGWIHQHRCHSILASLRAKDAAKNVSYEYKVPFGDWFEYVSSAHYLAEFVMYFGFIVLTGGRNLDTWLLFAFVVLNLSIAAGHTHKWYKRKFENYPKSRKAIIPFIY
ncbi:hypothetical protein KP509_08G012000 [Ceratopteris richardii]|nr:hypothetical protein KP509_08G012000 [Ceratopteris richardii]